MPATTTAICLDVSVSHFPQGRIKPRPYRIALIDACASYDELDRILRCGREMVMADIAGVSLRGRVLPAKRAEPKPSPPIR